MKLNKPIITICIIILLVVNLVFFSFLSIGHNLSNKEKLNEIIEKFDFKSYLLNNETINNSIKEYHYSEEVFNYMDQLQINKIKKKLVNNLYDNKEELINEVEIKELINNSVYEYESRTQKDIFGFVESDVNTFSNEMALKFNDNYSSYFQFVKTISNGIIYYSSIILSIVFIGLIIFYEKKNGLLISSIILICYSIYVFYMDNNFIRIVFNRVLKYFESINLHLDKLYIICFLVGFVLLLIYIVNLIKHWLRDLRIRSYISSWR